MYIYIYIYIYIKYNITSTVLLVANQTCTKMLRNKFRNNSNRIPVSIKLRNVATLKTTLIRLFAKDVVGVKLHLTSIDSNLTLIS